LKTEGKLREEGGGEMGSKVPPTSLRRRRILV